METCLTLRTDRGRRGRCCHASAPGVRVGIIGGGFIGLELASTARLAGAEVTVLEAGPRLMGRAVPAEISEAVFARHQQ